MDKNEAIHFLTHDQDTGEYTGDLSVPCSRWGHNSADCAEVAYDLDVILSAETGEGVDERTLNGAMSLVVNDHDDVAYTFAQYGDGEIRAKYADELAEWGNPDAYNETGDPHAYEERYLAEARYLGADAAMAAASWIVDMSESDARSILEDVDPEVMDRYREPNLSGEFTDDPTSDSLAAKVIGTDLLNVVGDYGSEIVNAIADAWEDGRDQVWDDALQAHALRVLGRIDNAVRIERELEAQVNELRKAARS